jgi:ABC-type Fe3+/spermidine/putrescine transport system ATPase subunit
LKASIVEDLRGWNQTQRIPILYVTHSRDEVDALAERVIAIERGSVIGQGHPREVLDAPRRTGLALAAGFENLLDATVVSLREADGVMSARLAETAVEIEVPLSYATPGDRVRHRRSRGRHYAGDTTPERPERSECTGRPDRIDGAARHASCGSRQLQECRVDVPRDARRTAFA